MRSVLFVLLSIFSFCSPSAQTLNRDSLLRLLAVAKNDTNKVHLLFSLSDQYETSEPDRAKQYTRQAGELSKSLGFETGVFKQYKYLAYIAAYQSQFDSMLHYSKIVLDIAQQKKDSFGIGVAYFNIGEAYKFLSDYENGLEYSLQGLRILQGKGHTNIESNLYGGLQGTYLMLKQYDKSIEYGIKAVELGRKIPDKNSLVSALTNLANSYTEVGKFTAAKKIYNEAIDISSTIGNTTIEGMCYQGLTNIALKENDYDSMKTYAERALALHSQIENKFGIMESQQSLALYFLQQKDFATSKARATSALVIAEQENFTEGKADVLSTLSAISFATHDIAEGFRYANESKKIKETIFTNSVANKDAQLRVKYETEKKDSRLKLQQATIRQKNTLNYILIGTAATLAFICFLLYRNYQQKQKLQQQRIYELETEKQLLATEAVLKGEEQERTRLAKDLHDGLGGMLSGIKYSFQNMKGNLVMTPDNQQAFERSMDMLDSSIREMRRVAHNMMPEALVKFGLDTALKDFVNDINQSGALVVSYQSIGVDNQEIDQTTAIAVYRIVQELVHNTMKHAAATTAIIQVSKRNTHIAVTVEDDGKGFDPTILRKAGGIGWSNIQNRVEFLKGTLDVKAGDGNGTSVFIEFDL